MRTAAALKRDLDPRVERSRSVILEASLQELGEVGYGAFTIESVAARAGVGKSTIYRHWPDKLSLIADAFRTFHEERGPDIASGTPRERIERVLRHVAEIVAGSTFSKCIPALIDAAERDRDLRRFHHRFQREARRPLVALIAEGVASGDFHGVTDPELAAVALLGVIFYRRLMSGEPLDPERARELAAEVLH
ncbi:MAG TPA: TetR/AcrR family transcriptional regulator [Stellaceae bacterium]|nr:TetR/AcrR family transcriptional regulator [Stellaceae bacterium]